MNYSKEFVLTWFQTVSSATIPFWVPWSFPQQWLSLSLPRCLQGWIVFSNSSKKPQPIRWRIIVRNPKISTATSIGSSKMSKTPSTSSIGSALWPDADTTIATDVPIKLIPARRSPKNISLPLCLWSLSPILLTGRVNQVLERRWIILSFKESRWKSVFRRAWRRRFEAQPMRMGSTSRRTALVVLTGLQLWDVRGKFLSSRMYASSPQDVKLQLDFKVLVTSRCLSQGWRGIPRYEASALIVIFDRSTQPWAPATRNPRISWEINPDCKMWNFNSIVTCTTSMVDPGGEGDPRIAD